MQGKNILITGAGGFIGTTLRHTLAAQNSITGIYSRTRNDDVIGDVLICDLTDDAAVTKSLAEISTKPWDTVVHLASVLCNDSTDDHQVFQSNIDITRNIVRICRECKVTQLLHASSIAVYPTESGIYDEQSAVHPAANAEGMYGLAKVCAENYFDHQLRGCDTEILHLRLAQVWGKGMRSDRIFSIMHAELEADGCITVFGMGERTSNFIHIDLLISTIQKLIESDGITGIYNLGSETLSYLQLAERIAIEAGAVPAEVIRLVEKGSRARFELNTSKLESLLMNLP